MPDAGDEIFGEIYPEGKELLKRAFKSTYDHSKPICKEKLLAMKQAITEARGKAARQLENVDWEDGVVNAMDFDLTMFPASERAHRTQQIKDILEKNSLPTSSLTEVMRTLPDGSVEPTGVLKYHFPDHVRKRMDAAIAELGTVLEDSIKNINTQVLGFGLLSQADREQFISLLERQLAAHGIAKDAISVSRHPDGSLAGNVTVPANTKKGDAFEEALSAAVKQFNDQLGLEGDEALEATYTTVAAERINPCFDDYVERAGNIAAFFMAQGVEVEDGTPLVEVTRDENYVYHAVGRSQSELDAQIAKFEDLERKFTSHEEYLHKVWERHIDRQRKMGVPDGKTLESFESRYERIMSDAREVAKQLGRNLALPEELEQMIAKLGRTR